MDNRRFDDLTRTIAHRANGAVSRRGFTRGLLAAGLGLGLGIRRETADAACPAEHVNRRGIGCVCRATGRLPGAAGCPCPSGLTRCDEACVDTTTDLANCGGCGRACPPGACQSGPTCAAGSCGFVALADGTPCGGDGSELRCCGGACPTPACLDRDACCADEAACEAQCCTAEFTTVGNPQCPSGLACGLTCGGGSCARDSDCSTGSAAEACVCGICREGPVC